MTVSFERDIETQRAKGMVNEWLEKVAPNARAATFFHRDTDDFHGHIWIDARQIDGKKIDLAPRNYKRLDEEWNKIYCRELGRDEREHLDKKAETREYKRAMAQGEERPPPERAETSARETYAEREQRNAGTRLYDEAGVERHQPTATESATDGISREHAASIGERELERFAQNSQRATGVVERTVSEVAGLRDAVARVGGRERSVDRNTDRGSDR